MSNNDAENPEIDLSRFQLLHEVFRHRAADPIQRPLMAFPKSGFADYEYFTGKVLDQFTDTAAWHYAKANIQTVRQNDEDWPNKCQYLYSRILIGLTSQPV